MAEYDSKIIFTKMQGAGNDYVYIDARQFTPPDPEELARQISDRHYGVGGDGLVAIMNSENADFRMRMFNADGSEAEMCGNASRCIGKYVYEKGLTDKTVITLETLAGIKVLRLDVKDGKVRSVTVDMGEPVLIPSQIPVLSRNSEKKIFEKESIGGKSYHITAVSMGNPHAVIFSDELTDALVREDGARLEVAEIFPQRANIEFVTVLDRNHLRMRVWERGSGETLACGTGACAAAVAAVLNGFTERKVMVALIGGNLEIEWDEESGHVFLTGGAEFVADGVYYYKRLRPVYDCQLPE